MKKLKIILLALLFLFALVFIGAYIFVNLKGKDIVAQVLKDNFKTQAKIEKLTFTLPFTLEIDGFSCGDAAFKKLRVTPLAYNFAAKELIIAAIDIDGLDLKVTMDKEKIYTTPFFTQYLDPKKNKISLIRQGGNFEIIPQAYAAETPVVPAGPAPAIAVTVNAINLKNSLVTFVDASGKAPINIHISDIEAKISGFNYPDMKKFSLDILTSLEIRQVKAEKAIKVKGWVDYLKKDMDVDINATGLRYSAFLDYMPQKWLPDTLGLAEAYINAKVKATAKNDDMLIDALVIFDREEYKPGSEDNPLTKNLKTTLQYLRTKEENNGQAQLPNFQFHTKLSAPAIDPQVITKTLTKMLTSDFGFTANIIMNAIESVKGTKNGGSDNTVAVNSAVDLLSGLLGGSSKSK